MSNKGTITFKEYRTKYNINATYNKPNSLKEEGVDHINISIASRFPACKMLDPRYNSKIQYPHIGNFNSVLGLLYWLRSPEHNDELRLLSSYKLWGFIKKKNIKLGKISNHSAIFATATWIKLKNNPSIIKAIKDLPDLEIVSYNIMKGTNLRIPTPMAKELIAISRELIAAIKEDREPDIFKFVNSLNHVQNDFLTGIIEFIE